MHLVHIVLLLGFVLLWYNVSIIFHRKTSEDHKAVQHFVKNNLKTTITLEKLDWKEYVESNPDLVVAVKNQKDAINHTKHGQFEGRQVKVIPSVVSWTNAIHKIKRQIMKYKQKHIAINERNLVIFHVGELDRNTFSEVYINNMKIFASSILTHSRHAKQQAVYLFNVVGGVDNTLLQFIPNLPNVVTVEWEKTSSDMMTHIRTVNLLGPDIVAQFKALVFLNQGVRGPLTHRKNGDWLTEFRRLLDSHNVGLVGSTISCESTPHVQTHVFGIHSHLFTEMMTKIESQPRAMTWLGIIAQYELGLSTTVLKSGYNISALLYDSRMKTPYFAGQCIDDNSIGGSSAVNKASDLRNPTAWCDVKADEVIFMKWGGEPLRINGYYCPQTVSYMADGLENLAIAEPQLGLIVPETAASGRLYDLYREYTQEMWVDRLNSVLTYKRGRGVLAVNQSSDSGLIEKSAQQYPSSDVPTDANYQQIAQSIVTASATTFAGGVGASRGNVCFLVRTYDMSAMKRKSLFIHYGLPDLIQSLLKQTSPHWIAYFFNTDLTDYDTELQRILRVNGGSGNDKYSGISRDSGGGGDGATSNCAGGGAGGAGDDRLRYVHIPVDKRPQFTTADAGYTATDYVLHQLLLTTTSNPITDSNLINNDNDECLYISVTNGDNIYGSEVVERVLYAAEVGKNKRRSQGGRGVDMILNPLDSRNFAEQDYVYRKEKVKNDWTTRCHGIQAMLFLNRLAYTTQPIPIVGGVDLASVFLNREKLAQEWLYFSNFTDPIKYPCTGCQDGYFTEYLVRNRLWSYQRLATDGLKSIVFHGPSPTYCIASGNVWLDHPHVSQVGCYSHSTVRRLREDPTVQSLYDWGTHHSTDRLCLRFNEKGYKLALAAMNNLNNSIKKQQGRFLR